jgi:hypothetical protein
MFDIYQRERASYNSEVDKHNAKLKPGAKKKEKIESFRDYICHISSTGKPETFDEIWERYDKNLRDEKFYFDLKPGHVTPIQFNPDITNWFAFFFEKTTDKEVGNGIFHIFSIYVYFANILNFSIQEIYNHILTSDMESAKKTLKDISTSFEDMYTLIRGKTIYKTVSLTEHNFDPKDGYFLLFRTLSNVLHSETYLFNYKGSRNIRQETSVSAENIVEGSVITSTMTGVQTVIPESQSNKKKRSLNMTFNSEKARQEFDAELEKEEEEGLIQNLSQQNAEQKEKTVDQFMLTRHPMCLLETIMFKKYGFDFYKDLKKYVPSSALNAGNYDSWRSNVTLRSLLLFFKNECSQFNLNRAVAQRKGSFIMTQDQLGELQGYFLQLTETLPEL